MHAIHSAFIGYSPPLCRRSRKRSFSKFEFPAHASGADETLSVSAFDQIDGGITLQRHNCTRWRKLIVIST